MARHAEHVAHERDDYAKDGLAMHGGKHWRLAALLALTVCLGCASGPARMWTGWWNPSVAAAPAPVTATSGDARQVNHEEEIGGASAAPASSGAVETPGVIESTSNTLSSFVRSFTGGKKPPSTEAEKRRGQALYDEAEVLFRAGAKLPPAERAAKFSAAEPKYAAAAELWRDSAVEENGLFGVAECRFFTDQFDGAEQGYEALLKAYPNTRHLDIVSTRRFAIAQFWLALYDQEQRSILTPNWTDKRQPMYDTWGSAVKLLDRIRLDDPTGKLADDATMLAANSCFRQSQWMDADQYYADLRKNFPDSTHQFQAYLLGVQCKLRIYQGADYEQSPLVDAEKLVKSMFRQFPQEAAAEKEHLDKAFKEIRLKKAQAEWELAQYYDNKGEYRAARFHYDRVVRFFGDTNLAEESKKRVTEIAGKPPVPENRFAWFTDLLDRKNGPLTDVPNPNSPNAAPDSETKLR